MSMLSKYLGKKGVLFNFSACHVASPLVIFHSKVCSKMTGSDYIIFSQHIFEHDRIRRVPLLIEFAASVLGRVRSYLCKQRERMSYLLKCLISGRAFFYGFTSLLVVDFFVWVKILWGYQLTGFYRLCIFYVG